MKTNKKSLLSSDYTKKCFSLPKARSQTRRKKPCYWSLFHKKYPKQEWREQKRPRRGRNRRQWRTRAWRRQRVFVQIERGVDLKNEFWSRSSSRTQWLCWRRWRRWRWSPVERRNVVMDDQIFSISDLPSRRSPLNSAGRNKPFCGFRENHFHPICFCNNFHPKRFQEYINLSPVVLKES